jgi:hypothetical protein
MRWKVGTRGGAAGIVAALAAVAIAAGAAASPGAARRFDAERVGQGVLLRWSATSAADTEDTAGYNVYRRVAGGRVRVNVALIPSDGDGRGHVYRWLDRTSNRKARYWLQVVRVDGTRAWRGETVAG